MPIRESDIIQLRTFYDPNWTAIIRERTNHYGLLAIMLSKSQIHVLMSKSDTIVDVQGYYRALEVTSDLILIDAVVETADYGWEMRAEDQKEVFAEQFVQLKKTFPKYF